jgi:NAD(P) transhydrogenase
VVTCKDGKDVKAPPPPKVGPPPAAKAAPKEKAKPKETPLRDAITLSVVMTVFVIMVLAMGEGAPITVIRSFLLAGAAGYQAVWGVAHALHTPLMSVTNAISGMTVIGGMHLFQECYQSNKVGGVAYVLGGLASLISAVNITGGFAVTQRMLNLFKRKQDVDYSGTMALPCLVLAVWSVFKHNHEEEEVQNTLSSLLCVMSIACLATMKSANLGCKFGMIGVFCALVTMFVSFGDNYEQLFGILCLVGVGGGLGLFIGLSVTPIALPQTVAAFHSLVGLAAMLTSIGIFYGGEQEVGKDYTRDVSILLGNFIGGITLTGSLVAFGKLSERLSSKELNLPGKNMLNLSMLFGFFALGYVFLTQGNGNFGCMLLWGVAALACVLGVHLVGSVGGGDMPVCITVLNSYSGWALAAEGFVLEVPMLAVVGSIIGFSGAILTKIMCDAMNRDIFNVIFGGMNVAAPTKSADGPPKVHVEAKTPQVAELLAMSKEVLVVPGYGMAVARAQNAVGEVAKELRDNDIACTFCIHPVAGRMPGQMNVLLAEAGVPYDWVKEMDECNPDMEKNDVCLVMGANDITNSAAQEIEGCAIWGMPVIEVWRAKKVVFCKRSMATGYAALDNPVFFKENTWMLLGDAAKTASALVTEVREYLKKA